MLTGLVGEGFREVIDSLLGWAIHYPHLWEILVGAYFSNSGRDPGEILFLLSRWDWDPGCSLAKFQIPPSAEGDMVRNIAASILDGKEHLFTFSIKWMELRPDV